MTRWWFILLAVVLGWFTPAHAFAHTRTPQGEYDVEASLEKVVSVAGITMDTSEGNNNDPLSLHKYLYCEGNPVNMVDPSGHDGDLITFEISSSIGASMDAMYNGGVLTVYNALKATINGVQANESAQQILTDYLVDTAIGVGVGVAVGVAAKLSGVPA